jgi:hypothetical protein
MAPGKSRKKIWIHPWMIRVLTKLPESRNLPKTPDREFWKPRDSRRIDLVPLKILRQDGIAEAAQFPRFSPALESDSFEIGTIDRRFHGQDGYSSEQICEDDDRK